MSATDNIVQDDLALNNLALNNLALSNLALGARLRVAELADVQAMHRMETALFPADAWHIDMFLEELIHPTRTYYMLELPVENPEGDEGSWRTIGYCGTMVVADTADVQTIGVLPEYEATASAAPCLSRCTSVPASRVPSASCWRCVPTTRALSASTNATATVRFTYAAATTMTEPTPSLWNVRSK